MSTELDDTMPAARDSGPLLPSRISRFEVRDKLGEGGNGVVLLARDPTLDRNVAIKILRRNNSPEASQRLLREAQSAAKLAHDNVIVVHEVGTFEDQVYVAMEHVPGGTLTEWQRGRPWREVLDTYLRAGRGLAAAHAAGMVHRDFKPDNVLVGEDGRVRITDFGLVSLGSGRPLDEVRDLELTRTGTVMGTPRYMAPEQHLGEDVDARTDQFAFCVALYEAVWKRAPFQGDTYGALADAVVSGEIARPPPSDVPASVRAAILRGLARNPAERFPSMTALLAELAPKPRRRRWPIPVAVAVVVGAALAAFLLLRGHRETVRDAFERAQAAYKDGDYVTAAASFKRAFELDPDLEHRGPIYLYDMAAAYKQMGNCPEAVKGFSRYLALGSNVPDRERVEKLLRELGDCQKPDETAEQALKIGEDAYTRGDFASAAAAFKRAYALDPKLTNSPAYLYDIAQSYRQMGECAQASFAYKRFLALKGDLKPDNRARIEGLIRDLDACVAQQGSATR